MSAAVASTAAAQEHDVDATLSQETYEAVGDEVTVEFDLSPAAGEPVEYDGGDVTIEYDDDVLEFAGAEDNGANALTPVYEDNGTIGMVFLEGDATDDTSVSLTFEVTEELDESHLTIADGAFAHNEEELAVQWSDGKIYSEDGENWWDPYTNEDDEVETDGLRTAIDDWRTGDLGTDLLRDVIDHWRTGDTFQ